MREDRALELSQRLTRLDPELVDERSPRALVASGRPLTLLVDDLQWCDEATLELLAFFLHWPSTTNAITSRSRGLSEA